MDAAFSTLNRRPTQQSNMMATSSLARSSTVASTTNPFLNMTNQQPTDNTFMTNNFNSPYATIGHAPAQGYAAISNTPTIAFASSTVAAPSTASIIGNNYFQSLNLNSSNTNRTALSTIDFGTSNSSNLNPNIPVAKPMVVPQATGSVFHSNRNPFSPVTPPLTPNQPNNLFMSLPSTTSPVSRNPFSQQNFPNHTTTMNQQFQSSAF
ncbi:MAG: hypothetical protein EXX96DRAFT_352285 [Benjaminiella poitrasii]|nr:MAG: hypothetical protein EXX96DRAFT_352285 [Benjaminiella poitrasii]